MQLATNSEEYFKITSAKGNTFITTKPQMDEWVSSDKIFEKLTDEQIDKFSTTVHYHDGRGVGDIYYQDLFENLTEDEFKYFLSKLGMSFELFSVYRDSACDTGLNLCRPAPGMLCPYLYGMGCA